MQATLFINWINKIIYHININQLSEGDILYFDNMFKFFTSDKLKLSYYEIANAIYNGHETIGSVLTDKALDIIIKKNNVELLNIIATTLSNRQDKRQLLNLILKLKNNNVDYSYYEDLFIESNSYFDKQLTCDFLSVVNKDNYYLIRELLSKNNFVKLGNYLEVNAPYFNNIEIVNVCKCIAPYLDNIYYINDFFEIALFKFIKKCCNFEINNFDCLLQTHYNRNKLTSFFTRINDNHFYVLELYSRFLYIYHNIDFNNLEDKILNNCTPYMINQFSILAPFCSKRKILNKLIESKNKFELEKFIKSNYEFQKLLPML